MCKNVSLPVSKYDYKALSHLSNTHRKHMGKHSLTVTHTQGGKHKRLIGHMHVSKSAVSAAAYVLCTFKSSQPLTSQALIKEQQTPQPLCHLNRIKSGWLASSCHHFIPANEFHHILPDLKWVHVESHEWKWIFKCVWWPQGLTPGVEACHPHEGVS